MLNSNPSPTTQTQRPREVAFAFNLVSAITYVLLIFIETHGLDYYLFRAALRVDDILHLSQANAVTTEALRRNTQNSSTLFTGMELVVLISMFAGITVVLLFLKLIPGAWHNLVLGNRCSGFLAFFALPLGYLGTLFWHPMPGSVFCEPPFLASQTDHSHAFWLLVAADVICVTTLSVASWFHPISRWTISILLIFHCAFWLVASYSPLSLAAGVMSLSLAVFPFSVAVWLWYLNKEQAGAGDRSTRRNGKSTVAIAFAFGLVLFAIWYPGRTYSLANLLDSSSMAIEMSRGPCYGSCAVYSITLHGDGLVEYAGTRFVRVKEKQTTRISSAQLAPVLLDLDRLRFFTIDDRAFPWCFDSASTSISVSVGGKQKSVTTDNCAVGPKDGTKAQFLKIAHEIDEITGSKQWVQCDGSWCRK